MKKSRRILSIILTALMVVTMIPFTPVDFAASAAATASDDGTALTPTMISAETYKVLGLTDSNWSNYEGYYAIGTPQELRGFSALVKGGETTANALLLRNIVCNKAYEWEPIGIGEISYKGTFDGNGCTVSGLSIDESEEGFGSDWGMFGVCVDATIKNLILSDSSISGSYTIGGIVGSAYDVTIENCKVTATVSVTANDLYTSTENPETNGAYVGGIVGSSFRSANLRNCVSFATVWSKRTAEYAGSVSGDIPSEYDNCFYLKGSASAGAGVTAPKRELYGIGLPSDQITAEDGCITLESSDSAHTCISVTHQQINANCLYTGLSEYSFCLICDKVTADTKTVLPLDFGNHIGAETEIQQSTTSGKHNIVYLCCGEIKETVDCVYGDSGNCNEVQICTQCGATGSVISDKHTGTATEYRKVNDTTHQLYYLCCDAPVAGTSQPHTMSKAADCQNGAYCSICKDYFGEKDPSNHTSQTFVNQQVAGNDTQHKRMHSCCEAYTMEDHDYTGTGNCLNSQRCSDCHYIGPKVPNNHAYKRYILISNGASGHTKAHKCCEAVVGSFAHTYNTMGICDCGYVCPHTSSTNGICNTCKYNSKATVSYYEWDEASRQTVQRVKAITQLNGIASNTETLNAGWYYVNSDIVMVDRFQINGEVHIILADNITFYADGGIGVHSGNTLHIHATSTNGAEGRLIADANKTEYIFPSTGIGGSPSFRETMFYKKNDNGSIIIHGGKITAVGGNSCAAIGGGSSGYGGNITIHGGVVDATGGYGAAAIGSGVFPSYSKGSNAGTITINGGTVKATATKINTNAGAGIGAGSYCEGGTVIITGGNVIATAANGAEDIGKGYNGSSSGSLTNTTSDVSLQDFQLLGITVPTAITAIKDANGNLISYGLNDVYTTTDGKLYIYLPQGVTAASVVADGQEYAIHEHTLTNGFCSQCDLFEPAELKDGYYQIANAGQLFWFAKYINTVDRTANAVLVDDIDLENRPWSPIGFTNEKSNNFRGHFDGQGHTITGLYVEGDRAGLGFFGEVRTGTVENFTIYGEVVVNKEYNYVGGVIGSACGLNSSDHGLERNGATIRNITSYVNLTAGAHGIGMVGGFIGYANHETLIENCSWYGNFDAGIYRVDSGAGGFIGRIYDSASVTIRNCAAYGTITTEYKSGTFESRENIYIGGFLSYSPSGAQTVMENNLWAGRIINNTNLSAENAHLSAYGTLTSFKSVTNCYMEEGSAAYITTSNVNTDGITTVTAAQLKSGEIAYLLQGEQTEELWGQKIGTDDYPVLGGAKVYQVTNCKDEAVYSNTNENIGHSYENGTCTVCGTTVFSLINGAAFDSTDSYIYGFAPGITSLDDYTEILVDGYEWTYTPGQFGGFGTGTKATLKKGDTTVAEYIVLIYGDLNGDGWYDGEDAFLANLIVKGMLKQADLPDYMWKAADCNHDGEINETDVDLLMGAGLKKNDIDQNASQSELSTQAAYIEYMSIIDQSAGLDIEPDTDETQQETTTPETNETVEPDEPAEDSYFGIFISKVFLFIRKIFNFVFSFVIK